MTNVARRIENEDKDIKFARRKGRVWHVLQPEGKRAECGVAFSGHTDVEVRDTPHALGDCCTRRGCREMFEYADDVFYITDGNEEA